NEVSVRSKLDRAEIESKLIAHASYETANLIVRSGGTGKLEYYASLLRGSDRSWSIACSSSWNDSAVEDFLNLYVSKSRACHVSKARFYSDVFVPERLVWDNVSLESDVNLLREAPDVREKEERS